MFKQPLTQPMHDRGENFRIVRYANAVDGFVRVHGFSVESEERLDRPFDRFAVTPRDGFAAASASCVLLLVF